MSQHTPGPWQIAGSYATGTEYFAGPSGYTIADSKYKTVCTTYNPDWPQDGEANARRIVACVNYCEGVATAELEQAPDHLKLRQILDFIDNDVAALIKVKP